MFKNIAGIQEIVTGCFDFWFAIDCTCAVNEEIFLEILGIFRYKYLYRYSLGK